MAKRALGSDDKKKEIGGKRTGKQPDKLAQRELQKLKQKKSEELTKREKQRVKAEQAISPTMSGRKEGVLPGKKSLPQRRKRFLQQYKNVKPGELDLRTQALQGKDITLAPFLEQSKTGVISVSQMQDALKQFSKNLKKQSEQIEDVSLKKGKESPRLQIESNYRTTTYELQPKNIQLESTGWRLDVPEEFKKVSDDKYVAPKKKYEKKEEDDEEEYGKYRPTEIYLTDKDKISKIIERGVYEPYQEQDRGELTEKKKPYEKAKKEFYEDKGYLQRLREWAPYTSEEQEIDRGRYEKSFREDVEELYKSLDIQYTPKGFMEEYKSWDTYETLDKETEYADKEVKEEKHEPYLKEKREYKEGMPISREKYGRYEEKRLEKEKPEYEEKIEVEEEPYKKAEYEYKSPGDLFRKQTFTPYEKKKKGELDTRRGRIDKDVVFGGVRPEKDIYYGKQGQVLARDIYGEFKQTDIEEDKERPSGKEETYKEIYAPFRKTREKYSPEGQLLYSAEYTPEQQKDIEQITPPRDIRVPMDRPSEKEQEELYGEAYSGSIPRSIARPQKIIPLGEERLEYERRVIRPEQVQRYNPEENEMITKKVYGV